MGNGTKELLVLGTLPESERPGLQLENHLQMHLNYLPRPVPLQRSYGVSYNSARTGSCAEVSSGR